MYRTEYDTLGPVKVQADRYWGPQTQRACDNFRVGSEMMPPEIIHAYAVLKKAAACENHAQGKLKGDIFGPIVQACEEVTSGRLDDHFPLKVWQSGSGTQTNMNLNEVIANRAHVIMGGKLTDKSKKVHPNDHVNMSQSTNYTFPAAMHIATYSLISGKTIPALEKLRDSLDSKAREFSEIVKTGRTHMMDATPLTVGQEFSAFVTLTGKAADRLRESLDGLAELAMGGTAVGTGLNAPEGFDKAVAERIAGITGLPFRAAPNKFEAISAHDAVVNTSGELKSASVTLMKLANDIRLLASGPRSGIGELILPSNEPGSSIMPGKVNPTQAEMISMVAAQVTGNDTAVTLGGMGGSLQLNVYKPLLALNILQSAKLIADASYSFAEKCVDGIRVNTGQVKRHLENSLMLVTALNPHIGYDKAAKIAKHAWQNKLTLREAAMELGIIKGKDFDNWVDPEKMV